MAKMKKVNKPHKIKDTTKPKKARQGHKLVWLTLIVIAIPCALVAYILIASMGTQNTPVTGNRFGKEDLNPAITKSMQQEILASLEQMDWIDSVSLDLKSATLRVMIDSVDDSTLESTSIMIDDAVNRINAICPLDTYFTNTESSKMYDLEINIYNYIVDDAHTLDGQIYLMYTKTGAGSAVIDNMNDAKNWDIVNAIKRE